MSTLKNSFAIIMLTIMMQGHFLTGTLVADDNTRVEQRQSVQRLSGPSEWDVKIVFAYDALALIGILNGDPYYQKYYKADTDFLSPKLSVEVVAALKNIKTVLKDENKSIVSATLTLFYSAVDPQSLEDLIAHTRSPEEMKLKLQKTPYGSDENWEAFSSIFPDLLTVFMWYEAIDLEGYWQKDIQPKLVQRKLELDDELTNFAIQSKVEHLLGKELPNNSTVVYLNYYNKPHGIGLVNNAYITNLDWSLKVVVGNGPHELMHPPYEMDRMKNLLNAMGVLRQDSFLMDKVENHNPDFGYNDFDGYVEENIIQALDQIVSESGDIARDPVARWKSADDGIHVLAAVLYSLIKEKNFNGEDGGMDQFIYQVLKSGDLKAGTIESKYNEFMKAE